MASRPMTQMRASHSQGVVLLSVLWVLAIMAMLVFGATRMTRSDAYLAKNISHEITIQRALDSALTLTLAEMVEENQRQQLVRLGRVAWQYNGVPVVITIADEARRLDLNVAREGEIAALLGERFGRNRALAMAAAVLDYVDEDDTPRANGAESPRYRSLGYRAKNAPLGTIVELTHVRGIDAAAAALLEPHTTVYVGSRGVGGVYQEEELGERLPLYTPQELAQQSQQAERANAVEQRDPNAVDEFSEDAIGSGILRVRVASTERADLFKEVVATWSLDAKEVLTILDSRHF